MERQHTWHLLLQGHSHGLGAGLQHRGCRCCHCLLRCTGKGRLERRLCGCSSRPAHGLEAAAVVAALLKACQQRVKLLQVLLMICVSDSAPSAIEAWRSATYIMCMPVQLPCPTCDL